MTLSKEVGDTQQKSEEQKLSNRQSSDLGLLDGSPGHFNVTNREKNRTSSVSV